MRPSIFLRERAAALRIVSESPPCSQARAAAAIALAETKREAGLTVEFALVSSAEAALDYAKNRKISTLYQVEKEVTEVTVL